jgi:hypothetical protein
MVCVAGVAVATGGAGSSFVQAFRNTMIEKNPRIINLLFIGVKFLNVVKIFLIFSVN